MQQQKSEIWFRYRRFRRTKTIHWKAWALRFLFFLVWAGWSYGWFHLPDAAMSVFPPDSWPLIVSAYFFPMFFFMIWMAIVTERHTEN